MAPTTRSQGEPSSQPQQQPSPAKKTIKVQGSEVSEAKEEVEKEYPSEGAKGKGKGKGYLSEGRTYTEKEEPTVDEKLFILITELRALKKENAKLARQQQEQRRSSTLPLFGADQSRKGTIPPPSYHGMPEVKGYKPTPPKPYDGSTDVEGFLVQARLHLKFYENSLTEDYQKVMAIS
ncbi:hypothetical protein DL765_009527 [Monosporascus sp. GIB2]|nr:hypothetical protein DL765_009527 [Monosporascus sp. GIB2]